MSKTVSVPQPFVFDNVSNATTSESRKLDFTPVLINTANTRATELMSIVAKKPELHILANKAIDNGEPQDLINLINAVFNDEKIREDAKILEGCDDNQLGRLLESRRSDRSKAKAKGPRSSVQVCRTYIATMYAELMIRSFWHKPYTGQLGSTMIDIDALAGDQDAISRKVKSLQSKKSRLTKLAGYDAEAKAELKEVIDEIARLNELRPTVRTTSKVVVKDLSVDQLREVLHGIDPKLLPEEEQVKLADLMAKLG